MLCFANCRSANAVFILLGFYILGFRMLGWGTLLFSFAGLSYWCVFCFSLLFAFLLVNSITYPLFYLTFVVSFFLFLFSDSEFLCLFFASFLL